MIIENLMPINNSCSNTQQSVGLMAECKLPEGQAIPFKIDIQGNVFQTSPSGENKINVIQDIFVKTIGGDDLLFSLDGEKWSEFTELFTGSFGISFGIQDENPIIAGLVSANIRTQ